jgi:hypothetical protein
LLTIGIEQFIGREKLQIVSRAADDLCGAQRQQRREKQSLLILCADRTLKLLID